MHPKRRHMKALMSLLVRYERQVHYEQVRPFQTCHLTESMLLAALRSPQGVTMDCSEAVTLICRLAGLKDPNGFGYGSCRGNTETMLDHLPHYRQSRFARTGAIVHFDNPDHACIVFTPGFDPMLFSHGQERGPMLLPLSVERRYHPGPVTFLSIRGLL